MTENPTQLPTLDEVYEAYGVFLQRSATSISEQWELPVGFENELLEIAGEVSVGYVPRALPPFIYDGDLVPPPDIPSHYKGLLHRKLKSDPMISCSIYEVAGISSLIDRQKKQLALWLKLMRGDIVIFDGFLLHDGGSEWNYSHRLIVEEFRGKGLFGVGTKAFEAFVQGRANISGETQRITMNTGQPDVALSFLKQDYTPDGEEQNKRVRQMLNPSQKLFLAMAMKPSVLVGGDNYEPTSKRMASYYCFAKGENNLTSDDAYRVSMEKVIIPKQSEAIIEKVQSIVSDIVGRE